MSCVAFPRFLGPIPIDVVLTEDHLSGLKITENPIEFGADVADHAYIEPKRLRLHCAIGATSRVGGIIHGFPSTRVQAAWEAVMALQETKEPFDILTGLTLYRDMLIENASVFRDVHNAGILDFDVSLKQVIIAESAYVEGEADSRQGKSSPNDAGARPEAGDTEKMAAGEVNTGQQSPAAQATTTTTVTGAKNASLLHGMLGLPASAPPVDPSLPPI